MAPTLFLVEGTFEGHEIAAVVDAKDLSDLADRLTKGSTVKVTTFTYDPDEGNFKQLVMVGKRLGLTEEEVV